MSAPLILRGCYQSLLVRVLQRLKVLKDPVCSCNPGLFPRHWCEPEASGS